MKKLAYVLLPVALLGLISAVPMQRRAKDKPKADFGKLLEAASRTHGAGQWSECIAALDQALDVVKEKRRQAILDALPAAPEGFTVVPDKNPAAGNPFAKAMGGVVGDIMTREYRGNGGSIKITLTLDSPLIQMMNMAIQNPAMLGENKELVEYDQDKAVLETKGNGNLDLQIIVAGKHIVQAETRGLSDDQLFAMFDQGAVNKIRGALAN